ncbi:MAG TPA: hypothetical protein VJ835_10210 [Fimbriimonadaceae bacterium]|nr:hypothetical protein [Fimbriimonadaceae bacterium]
MKNESFSWGHVLATTAITTIATSIAVSILGRDETGSAAAPLNATSHIVWGDEAAEHDEVDVKHTLLGTVLNAGAMASWSLLQEWLLSKWVRKNPRVRSIAAGALTSTVAYAVDYFVVPKRLTPGFEKRLSKKSLFSTYVAFALALMVSAFHAPKQEVPQP